MPYTIDQTALNFVEEKKPADAYMNGLLRVAIKSFNERFGTVQVGEFSAYLVPDDQGGEKYTLCRNSKPLFLNGIESPYCSPAEMINRLAILLVGREFPPHLSAAMEKESEIGISAPQP